MCHKNFEIRYTKIFLNRVFAEAREIIQKSLILDSSKFVDFFQMFGPLVSFSYYLVLVLCIFNKILKLLIFSGKIMTCLANINPNSKTFLGVKSLFVNQFLKFCGTFYDKRDKIIFV